MAKIKIPFMVLSLVLTMFNSGYAADKVEKGKAKPAQEMAGPTPEQREEMALAHEKMATCLRSTTPIDECHDELMKECGGKYGKGGCPMMGGARHQKRMGK